MNKKSLFLAAAFGLCCHALNAQSVGSLPPLPVPFHWKTNIVAEPCRFFHFYGVNPDGTITSIGMVEDHMVEQFEKGLKDSPLTQFVYILRNDKVHSIRVWEKEPSLAVK